MSSSIGERTKAELAEEKRDSERFLPEFLRRLEEQKAISSKKRAAYPTGLALAGGNSLCDASADPRDGQAHRSTSTVSAPVGVVGTH